MSKISRRALARWAVDQLVSGKPAKDVAKQLAASMIQAGMSRQSDFLINDIAWELEQRQVLVIGKVTSARPLTNTLKVQLAKQLRHAINASDISIDNVIDKAVLGGMRVETARFVWDQTVSRKLAELKEAF